MGIKMKRSAVAGKVPVVGDLELGEFAINTYDGKVYLKKDNGTPSIVQIGGQVIGGDVQAYDADLTAIAALAGTTGLLRKTAANTWSLDTSNYMTAGPAFSVHKNGTGQTISSATQTKLTWATEKFDTNNNFASNKFTPTVAGYYLFTGTAYFEAGSNLRDSYVILYKNGSTEFEGTYNSPVGLATQTFSAIVYMNGSTDYVEMYAQASVGSGSITIGGSPTATYFQGVFLRS